MHIVYSVCAGWLIARGMREELPDVIIAGVVVLAVTLWGCMRGVFL